MARAATPSLATSATATAATYASATAKAKKNNSARSAWSSTRSSSTTRSTPSARSTTSPRKGLTIEDADLQRLSPLATDHITLTGRYRIALPEALRDHGAYRELNTTPALAA